MKKSQVAIVLLALGVAAAGGGYFAIWTFSNSLSLISAHQLSIITGLEWNISSVSSINKIGNISSGEQGMISGIQGDFSLKNNTSTTLSVNVIRFTNSSEANDIYINFTNSLFLGSGTHRSNNSTIINGTEYDLMIEPEHYEGTGDVANFTVLIAVHNNIFLEIMESGILFSTHNALDLLKWEIKSNTN